MRFRSAALPAFLLLLPAAAAAAPERPLRVVTSIPPLAMIAAELGGDRVVVQSILPPGADAHTFEPRPSDAKAVADADVIVSLGSEIDDWLARLIESGAKAQILRLDSHDSHDHDEGQGHAHEDPHVWLDPLWLRDHAVSPLYRAFAAADPAGAPHYGVASRAMNERLTDMDQDIRERFLRARTRNFVAWHPAWNGFAKRFGLNAIRAIGESEGREPSLHAMIAAVRAAKAGEVRALLVEPQSDARQAAVLAEEIGVPLVLVDPMGDLSSVDRSSYLLLMRFNMKAFDRALGITKDEEEEKKEQERKERIAKEAAAVSRPSSSTGAP